MEQEHGFSQTLGVWAFVLNKVAIETQLPFELAPGCFLDKATDAQRERVKITLTGLIGTSSHIQPEHLYEQEPICRQTESGEAWHYETLPQSDWRYYVVSTPDNGHTNFNLHLASNISDTPLELTGLHFFLNGGQGWRPGILQNHLQSLLPTLVKRVVREDLCSISEIYNSLAEIEGKEQGATTFPEVLRAMQMFDSLNLLPSNSDFHILGLFAIIEMLITHNPKLDDRGDSITHQMQSKIPLLSRRFDRPLDFAPFFQNDSAKKIWTAMYRYRSAIAHGGIPDFQSNDLRILKNADTVRAFLNEAVKALLRHSLKEPQLYRDLRDC